jgi:hypothetical protein
LQSQSSKQSPTAPLRRYCSILSASEIEIKGGQGISDYLNISCHLHPCSVRVCALAKLTGRIFQVVFTLLAIRQRNTIQIMGLVIFNACFVAYSAVQVNHSMQTTLTMFQVSEIPQSGQ